ncbi:MAG: hypothetical protein KF784_20075, partial [Fimbriimonadaceae bacterium]|nr:hypothetical protein [Fimbriimonadaceae bacterium]
MLWSEACHAVPRVMRGVGGGGTASRATGCHTSLGLSLCFYSEESNAGTKVGPGGARRGLRAR